PQLVLAAAFLVAACPLAASLADASRFFLFATFLASAGAFARSGLPGLSPWARALMSVPIEAMMPACLWQFAVDFPRVGRFAAFDRFARRTAGAVWILGALLCGTSVFGERFGGVGPLVALARSDPNRWFWKLFALMLAPAIAVIFVRARRAPSAERRRVT